MVTDVKRSPFAKVWGLPALAVAWSGGLYKERFDTCGKVTVPHLQKMFESREISHVTENFKIAAGEADGDFEGTVFGDGDFYKWMEAAAYTAAAGDQEGLLKELEAYVELIGRAQLADGYISTKQIISEKKGRGARLGDINEFEVYNFGHLFTAACLYKRVTGKDSFLAVAEKAAAYLGYLYEEAEKSGESQTAVCPSHYMGLAELYRTTGKRKYLEILKKALRLRDCVKEGLDDNQDRLPLREHQTIIGHAVRANYLYAGVADCCLEEEEPELSQVLHKVWNSLVTQKLYITGGCGALYNGASPYGNFFTHQLVHQAYGYEYQLPNVTAYNETCASVGGVYWAYRMFCLEKKAEYADILERMVLNVNLAAISLDGKRFFYENMLRRAKKLPYELIWGQERAEYILSYCCPPNLARLLAQLSEYAYVVDGTGIYSLLYGQNRAEIELESGCKAVLVQETGYPYDGRIAFHFEEVKQNLPLKLHLRIPSWVRGENAVEVADKAGNCLWKKKFSRELSGTYLTVEIENPKQTRVTLDLAMPVRLTCAHTLAEETCNQAAVERGPLVYCLEGIDAPVETIDDLYLAPDTKFQPEEMEIEGRKITALSAVFFRKQYGEGYDRNALYQDYFGAGFEPAPVRLIPYFAWANRGRGEMRVWLPLVQEVR